MLNRKDANAKLLRYAQMIHRIESNKGVALHTTCLSEHVDSPGVYEPACTCAQYAHSIRAAYRSKLNAINYLDYVPGSLD